MTGVQTCALPIYPGRLMREEVAYDGTVLVAVLPCKRVWFWHSTQKGAVELLNKIEAGSYYFYLVKHEPKCIIVKTKEHKFIAYLFDNNELSAVVDLYAKLVRDYPQQNVVNLAEIEGRVVTCGYEAGNLLIGTSQSPHQSNFYYYNNPTHLLDLSTYEISPLTENHYIQRENMPPNMYPIKKMVHKGYSVFRNIKDRKSTRLNSSHSTLSRMPSSA